MTQETLRRRLAKALLGFGIRIAPRHATQWGQAMLGELRQVKGEWAALAWAAGGASVLVKHALVALAFPGRSEPGLLPGGGFFEKEGSMRKASLGVIGACVAGALLFLLAPTFRQGLGVAMVQWRNMSEVQSLIQSQRPVAGLLSLERRAEARRDGQALAFVAVRTWESSGSTKLADKAVQLDPELTWIYGMASPTPEASERWIQKLKQWDPQNALPYFMEAENIDNAASASGRNVTIRGSVDNESVGWRNALASAFASSKLDDYADKFHALDQKVVARYNLNEPYLVFSNVNGFLPSYSYWDSSRYAQWLVKSGEALEKRGDQNDALENYLSVIRFGEMAKRELPPMYVVLKDAYARSAAIYKKRGDQGQAALYSYLADDIIREREAQKGGLQQTWVGDAFIEWSADVTKVAGLLLPICGAILLICAVTIVAKSRSLRLSSLRAGRGMAALGLGSAAGLLLASVLLYVSYGPYAEIFREFMTKRGASPPRELSWFLYYAQVPLGAPRYGNQAKYVSYFWLTVTVLCVIALVVISARHLHWRSKARGTT